MIFEHQSRNKKILLVIFLVFLSVGVLCLVGSRFLNKTVDESEAVRVVVEGFGLALKNVSLLSPTAAQDIEKNYGDFLAPALLAEWEADPSKALGRLTSSPWPDRIEIASIKQFGSGAYDVSGKIIEMTSVEETQGGIAGSRPVEIGVVKFGDRWLITGVSVLPYEANEIWKDYSGDGISFQYPETLNAQYISTQEWPPAVKVQSGTYSCSETPQEVSSLMEITTQVVVNSRTYCVDVKNEGAAGSVYSSYVYTTPKNGQLVSISFILRYTACYNYDAEQNQACTSEREAFNLDAIVDRIAQTVKWGLSQ